jgi:DNA-binding Xre family transcriptional regulator
VVDRQEGNCYSERQTIIATGGLIMGVVSRFKVLLAEKELEERRSITLRDVAKETGISIYTISGFANNTLKEYPADALKALCDYFGVSTGELIVYAPESESDIGAPVALAVN